MNSIRNNSTSFEAIENGMLCITQLKGGKSLKVKCSDLLDLILGTKTDECFSKDFKQLKYNASRQHLVAERNTINTYLTKGMDKKLIALLKDNINSNVQPDICHTAEYIEPIPTHTQITEEEFNSLSLSINEEQENYQQREQYQEIEQDSMYGKIFQKYWKKILESYIEIIEDEDGMPYMLSNYCPLREQEDYEEFKRDFWNKVAEIAEHDKKCDDWHDKTFTYPKFVPNENDSFVVEV